MNLLMEIKLASNSLDKQLFDNRLNYWLDEYSEIYDENYDRIYANQAKPALLFKNFDDNKKKSIAFAHMVLTKLLDLEANLAIDYVVDGGRDLGVDAIYFDDDLNITILQTKYSKDFNKDKNIDEDSINKIITFIKLLYDNSTFLDDKSINKKLLQIIVDIKAINKNSALTPNIKIYLCNNGTKWHDASQFLIDSNTSDNINWFYINHLDMLKVFSKPKKIPQLTLQLNGKWLHEIVQESAILISKISVQSLYDLIKKYGDGLLNENIRYFLGLNNKVNQGIIQSLLHEPDNLYFYNNGITVICEFMKFNASLPENTNITLDKMQIINGGQTCNTIYNYFKGKEAEIPKNAFILVKFIQSNNSVNFPYKLAIASNSQSPVNFADLHSNDVNQLELEAQLKILGYNYKRKRDDAKIHHNNITPNVLAEAVLVVLHKEFKIAKYQRKKHFTDNYNKIFKYLSAEQAVVAVKLFRYCETQRKNGRNNEDILFQVASYNIAAQMLICLKETCNITEINNKNFQEYIKPHLENGAINSLFEKSAEQIRTKFITEYSVDCNSIQRPSELRAKMMELQ